MEVRAQPLQVAAELAPLLRPQDVVLTLAAGLGAALLAVSGRAVQGWASAAATLAAVAAMPWGFRAVQRRWPNELTRFLATIVPPALGVVLIYGSLDPLVDLLDPRLADARLAQIDLQLFGLHPGIWLERHLPPHAVDALFLCYTSYYVWPVSVGLILFFAGRARAAELDRYILGYLVLMLGSYLGYLMVPAIGPRFYLVDLYGGPVHATALGGWFDHLYRHAPYFRDCFPSGHTALTLYVLYQARRLTPRWFWVILAPACGLILATLACRFHYGIDVVCGALLTVAAIVLADALHPRVSRLEVAGERWAMALLRR